MVCRRDHARFRHRRRIIQKLDFPAKINAGACRIPIRIRHRYREQQHLGRQTPEFILRQRIGVHNRAGLRQHHVRSLGIDGQSEYKVTALVLPDDSGSIGIELDRLACRRIDQSGINPFRADRQAVRDAAIPICTIVDHEQTGKIDGDLSSRRYIEVRLIHRKHGDRLCGSGHEHHPCSNWRRILCNGNHRLIVLDADSEHLLRTVHHAVVNDDPEIQIECVFDSLVRMVQRAAQLDRVIRLEAMSDCVIRRNDARGYANDLDTTYGADNQPGCAGIPFQRLFARREHRCWRHEMDGERGAVHVNKLDAVCSGHFGQVGDIRVSGVIRNPAWQTLFGHCRRFHDAIRLKYRPVIGARDRQCECRGADIAIAVLDGIAEDILYGLTGSQALSRRT